jgi:hypothetical protein
MAAKYILAALSIVFLALAAWRALQSAGRAHPQTRTWLLVGAIFGAVSAWLFYQQGT